jgi:hypothetical protein
MWNFSTGHYRFLAIGGGLVLAIGALVLVLSVADSFRDPLTGIIGAFFALSGAGISIFGATGIKRS